MREADIPGLVALHAASFATLATAYPPDLAPLYAEAVSTPEYAQEMRDSDMWLAERDGTLLGSAGWLGQPGGVARIRKVFVHPEAARQGLATRLVRAAEERARAAGHTRFMLRAYLSAVPFYESLGYLPDRSGERSLVGGRTMPVLFMRKD
jgi:putative acetyltransferase